MNVSSHEFFKCVQQESQLQVGIVIALVRFQHLDVEEDGTGEEGAIAHLSQALIDVKLLSHKIEE